MLNTDKGFERLVVDLAAARELIEITTNAGSMAGRILNYSGGVISLVREVSRFEKLIIYIPISSVLYIAVTAEAES